MTVWEWIKKSGTTPYGQARQPNPDAWGAGKETTLNPAAFPFPDSYDSVRVAPRQHWLRFENEKIRLIEVMYRSGERGDALHGHPYASVFARDSVSGRAKDEHLAPDSPLNGQNQGRGGPPSNASFPTCSTMGPQAPHRPENVDTIPIHFYRIEFKRIDGEAFRTNWAKWYPYMTHPGTYAQYKAEIAKAKQ
jgi:hypothetical protein